VGKFLTEKGGERLVISRERKFSVRGKTTKYLEGERENYSYNVTTAGTEGKENLSGPVWKIPKGEEHTRDSIKVGVLN